MKKKIFGAAFIIAIAVVAALNINLNTVRNSAGDLALANVEVLAQAEISPGDACYNGGKKDLNKPEAVVCGSPCYYEHWLVAGNTTSSYCK